MTTAPTSLRAPLLWLHALWTASVVPWLAVMAEEALGAFEGDAPQHMAGYVMGVAAAAWTLALLVPALGLAGWVSVKGTDGHRARVAGWFGLLLLGVVSPVFAAAPLEPRWRAWVNAWLAVALVALAVAPVLWAVRDLRAWRSE